MPERMPEGEGQGLSNAIYFETFAQERRLRVNCYKGIHISKI